MTTTTTTRTLLDFKDVAMTFPDGTVALSGVDLTVDRGEFVTVVGPSGCGKSTLLRIASGLETASHGTVELDTDAHRLRLPGCDAAALAHRAGQRRAARRAAVGHRRRAQAEGATRPSSSSASPASRSTCRARSPAACGCARRSHARSPSTPRSSCSTSRSARSTRSPASVSTTSCCKLFAEKQFAGLFITHSVSEAVYLSTKVIVMSGRPGKIVDTFEVPFDMPRDPDIRFTAEFAALVGKVSHALREGHA